MKSLCFMILWLFVATPAFALTANLSWTDTNTNEDGYKVESAPAVGGTFTALGQVGPNITAFSDASTAAGKCYRVFAFNTIGNGPVSSVACVGAVPANAPGNLVIVITP